MRHMSRLAVGIVLCVGWVAVPSASGSTVSNGPIAFSTHFVLQFGDRGVGAQIFTVPPNGGRQARTLPHAERRETARGAGGARVQLRIGDNARLGDQRRALGVRTRPVAEPIFQGSIVGRRQLEKGSKWR